MGWINVAKVSCPSCGAKIEVERSVAQSTCEYCGTTSLIQTGGQAPQPVGQYAPAMPTIAVASGRQARIIALVVIVTLLGTIIPVGYRLYTAITEAVDSFTDAMGDVGGAFGKSKKAAP